MSCKWACFLFEKLLKTLYLLLLIVLMTLWIVLCVEATRQIAEVGHLKQKGKLDDQHRRVLPLSAGMGGTAFTASTIAIANRFAIPRLHALTIFNTVLEEMIALMAIISLLLTARRLASLSLLLLMLIWFIEQYRISDLYHQIDYIDANNARIIIATHVIHFIVCLLGIILSCIDSLVACRLRRQSNVDKEATNLEAVVAATVPKVFAVVGQSLDGIEKRAADGDKKRPCAWIRTSTIVKKINGQKKSMTTDSSPVVNMSPLGSASSSSPSSSEGERPFLGGGGGGGGGNKKKLRHSLTQQQIISDNIGEIIETPIEVITKDSLNRSKF